MFSCKPKIEKPTVVTKSVGEVTETTAEVVCNVLEDGGAEVTSRGCCWSIYENPVIETAYSMGVGSGIGSYECAIGGLKSSTTYYVRAYATNSVGISYGDEKTFTTEEVGTSEDIVGDTMVVIVTAEVTNIKGFSAICGGDVINDGDAGYLVKGVCFSKYPNPIIEECATTLDGGGLGPFTSELTWLEANTTYYVRAYARTEKGVFYGEERCFTTAKAIQEPSGYINGYAYVDLGLSSGLKWATCNIGASLPEESGNYYAWGEITTKDEYWRDNCLTYLKQMGDISGDPQYDAATANWGGTWRTPTYNEIYELIYDCEFEWTQISTTECSFVIAKFIGPNGNFILLPCMGYLAGDDDANAGSFGYYLCSTPYKNYGRYAFLTSTDGGELYSSDDNRWLGFNVRPVSE